MLTSILTMWTAINSTNRVIDWLVLDQIPEKYKKEIEDAQASIDYMKRLYFISVKPVIIDDSKEDIIEGSK